MHHDKVLGWISIRPDISEQSIPALTYHFYHADRQAEAIICPCDGQGNFEGLMPIGAYRVVATNTNAKNVSFTGMFGFETATVAALPQSSSRAESIVVFFQPDAVYTVVPSSQLEVSEGDTVGRRPLPTLLTRTLTLNFNLDKALASEVAGMTGLLRGVFPSVNLATGRPSEAAMADSPTSGMVFDTEGTAGGFGTTVALFGIADPEHGQRYENTLSLTIEMNNGTTQEVDVDLTTVLSDIIGENQGEIPVGIPLEIDIKRTDIGLKAEVVPWANGGEVEAPVQLTVYHSNTSVVKQKI